MGNHPGSPAETAPAKSSCLGSASTDGAADSAAYPGTPTAQFHVSRTAQARSVTFATGQSRSGPRSNDGQMIFLSIPDPQRTTPEQPFSNGYANLNPRLLARAATAVTASRAVSPSITTIEFQLQTVIKPGEGLTLSGRRTPTRRGCQMGWRGG